jgi:hypothetical protein
VPRGSEFRLAAAKSLFPNDIRLLTLGRSGYFLPRLAQVSGLAGKPIYSPPAGTSLGSCGKTYI